MLQNKYDGWLQRIFVSFQICQPYCTFLLQGNVLPYTFMPSSPMLILFDIVQQEPAKKHRFPNERVRQKSKNNSVNLPVPSPRA